MMYDILFTNKNQERLSYETAGGEADASSQGTAADGRFAASLHAADHPADRLDHLQPDLGPDHPGYLAAAGGAAEERLRFGEPGD